MASGAAAEPPVLARDESPEAIWSALRLAGAVLLENAAATPREFEAVTERFAERFRVHQDPTRERYSEDDTTQGVSGGSAAIALHAERAYLPGRPELLFFGCLTPAASGGETTWCDGAALVDRLAPDDAQRLAAMTLVWRTSMERPMWQRLLGTGEADEAITAFGRLLDRSGEHAQAKYGFEGDTLYVDYRTPALTVSSISGRTAFANYLLLARAEPDGPRAAQADDRPVPEDLLRRVADAAEALTVELTWRRGDVAIIDNTRCLHGRRAIAPGERRILVRMGDVRPVFRERA